MKPVRLTAVGILGPGLDGWAAAHAVLRGERPFISGPVAIPAPEVLPPRDRRRCSDTVSLALHVARQTMQAAGLDAAGTPSVFANSAGDGQVVHRLLSALAKPGKPVSPTDFHNSVHNAPAFYWSLGAGCRAASTSIAAARFTFAAALLKAALQCHAEARAVLLVCFDNPLPAALNESYPLASSFGVGLALQPAATKNALAELDLQWLPAGAAEARATPPRSPALTPLCLGNPAARALPLLEAIAQRRTATLAIAGAHDAVLQVRVACP